MRKFKQQFKMNTQQSKNKELFKKQWNSIYQSKDSKLIMVGNVEGYKFRKEGSHYVILNKSHSNKREPNHPTNKQKTVFIPFDSQKFNFCNISNKEVLFHVNLDQQVIISKQDAHKITENFFDKQEGGQDDQIEAHTHPFVINTAPICRFHSLLSMYPDEQLPQVVGSDILLLLLNIFKILPGIKVGYNSIGAAASVNHLHFHILYSEDLIENSKLPIQTVEQKQWIKSSLINPHQQINLYSVAICINQISAFGSYAMVLKPYNKQNEKLQYAEVTNSLAFVFGIIVNQLIELNVPHNALISDNGQTIYIFVRDFSTPNIMFGWIQYSGAIVAHDQKSYEIKQQEIVAKKKSLTIDAKTIELLKSNIKKHLSKFI